MWEKMESWLLRPLKSVLRYCINHCYGPRKCRITEFNDITYHTNDVGISTKNIIKLLAFSPAITTASAVELPQLIFTDALNQTFFFAFDESASSGIGDRVSFNETIKIIINEILSQCNVNATNFFKYTPQIIANPYCHFPQSETFVFDLISDKTIPSILLDCINHKIFNKFKFCSNDPKVLAIVLGSLFGAIAMGAIVIVCFISYKNRDKIKTKVNECYLKFREIARPNVTDTKITFEDNSDVNNADETTALISY